MKIAKHTLSKMLVGTVISDRMEKTAVVEVVRTKIHPRYHKVIRLRKKFYVHNEAGAKTGNKVRIKECRPLSKTKHFVVIEILDRQ